MSFGISRSRSRTGLSTGGGGLRVPTKADQPTRDAFKDVDDRLRKIERSPFGKSRSRSGKQAKGLGRAKPEKLTKTIDSEVRGDIRVENKAEILGEVDIPQLFDGLIEEVPSETGGSSEAQRVLNIKSSVAIAPGSVSAETGRFRTLHAESGPGTIAIYPLFLLKDTNFIQSATNIHAARFVHTGVIIGAYGRYVAGTSVAGNIQVGGNDIISSDFTLVSAGSWTDLAPDQNLSVTMNDRLRFDITTVVGNVTDVSFYVVVKVTS